ncbi:hypothetical protein T439DRAFT_320292 [Meredithblackwellia eburnea MCA 4105]
MAPSLTLFEEESQTYTRRSNGFNNVKKEQISKLIPPWQTAAICIALGVILGRIFIPTPPPTFQDYSALRKAAPTIPDYHAVLSGTGALPESVANNLRLTDQECEIGFPLLWPPVRATRDQFRDRGGGIKGITLEDLDEAEEYEGTRVAIIDNRMYVKRFHAESKTRNEAVLASLFEAVATAPEPMPDVEFWFRGTDNLPEGPHFGLNKKEGDVVWLLPDFGFWSWAEPKVKGWNDYRRRAMAIDAAYPWSKKFGKLFWRGAFLSEFRKKLKALVAGFEWNDIKELDWSTLDGRIEMEDHCKHRYLAAIEGVAAYSGRLKYTLACRSVTVSHKLKWIQHFHYALDSDDHSPNQNIVELKSDGWDDLPAAMDSLLRDQKRAQKIASNALRTMRDRYLTPASVACYWRRVLAEYASLQQFQPTIGDGVDYPSFLMVGKVDWRPN